MQDQTIKPRVWFLFGFRHRHGVTCFDMFRLCISNSVYRNFDTLARDTITGCGMEPTCILGPRAVMHWNVMNEAAPQFHS